MKEKWTLPTTRALAFVLAGFASASVLASGEMPAAYPDRVFWGDTHLHTAYSADAYFNGTLSLTPEYAYQFARGETVTDDSGRPVQISRALDFLVVADHAEYLGVIRALDRGDAEAMSLSSAGRWRQLLRGSHEERRQVMMEFLGSLGLGEPIADSGGIEASAWQRRVAYAEAANQPGVFTALAGFEWTSSVDANNLHRVVVFRDDADRTSQVKPFTSFDSNDPEQLWAYLDHYEESTGGRVLAIPHNGNLSNGLMFSDKTLRGEPIDRDYAERRRRWEPLVEVTQIKGDGETHPLLSPNDEFANFGTWDDGNFGGQAKEPWMLRHEYARSALRLGMEVEAKVGANPYQFGLIGSTDSHTGLAGVEEDNFLGRSAGHGAAGEGEPLNWKLLAGGYTAVWASENTREALFDALQRREVYATTGSRITVRFFAGWDFDEDELQEPNDIHKAYARGVPMGGELTRRLDTAGSPTFLVAAQKDPEGANLDRVQVVKGWLDAEGRSHERVYDVALSSRKQMVPGKGVRGDDHQANPEQTGQIDGRGAVALAAVWRDPDFRSDQQAFYYLRVLEVPTPRWVVYEQNRSGASLSADAVRQQQERAYTSPIWYRPD